MKINIILTPLLLISFLFSHLLYAPQVTYSVTNNADSGVGSLRRAITDSNGNNPAPDPFNIIEFSSFVGGPTITPLTDLPAITRPVLIDGYTEPSSSVNTNPIGSANNAVITVEIRGPGAGLQTATEPIIGLQIQPAGSGSIIRGLAINDFARVDTGSVPYILGQAINVNGDNNIIEGNFIGVEPDGITSRPNFFGINVRSTRLNNTIGGTTNAARNLLAGAYGYNGVVRDRGDNTIIQGNTVGLVRSGAAIVNSTTAMGIISQFNSGAIIQGNVVAGHNVANIFLQETSNVLVQENAIGTDVTNIINPGNNGTGILLIDSPTIVPANNIIDFNLISGNTFGIRVGSNAARQDPNSQGPALPVINTKIINNIIGLNGSQTASLPNMFDGIWLEFAENTYIGNNTISGNGGNGIRTGKAKNTIINGTNRIGVNLLDAPFPNGGNGIQLGTMVAVGVSSFGEVVGGAQPNDGNIIEFNNGNGIAIVDFTQEETVQGNTITDNGNYGIYLAPGTQTNWIGGFRTAGDLRLIGDIQSQGNSNLGLLGTSNVITSNMFGGIFASSSHNNAFQTNIITTNFGNGIQLLDSSFNLVGGKFGGSSVSALQTLGNVITANSGFGVEVLQDVGAAIGNTIITNSIFGNANKGIALNVS